MMQLALFVLTSNDVNFGVGLTEQIGGETPGTIAAGYQEAAANLGRKPSLALAYAPLMLNVSGDFIVEAIDNISGGVPLFGMMSVDHNPDYHDSAVLFEGESYADRLAFVLISGNISPQFYLAGIMKEKLFRDRAVITASDANQLYSVNDMAAGDYLKTLGLTTDEEGNILGVNTYPFILDYGDGTTPIIRVMFGITAEGVCICGGDMPVGASLTVGSIDDTAVLDATADVLKDIRDDGKKDVTLIFSCVGRYFALGYEPEREVALVKEALGGISDNYLLTYAGGEICAVYGEIGSAGGTANRFHNDTFVACTF
jgi:hypothetical protein